MPHTIICHSNTKLSLQRLSSLETTIRSETPKEMFRSNDYKYADRPVGCDSRSGGGSSKSSSLIVAAKADAETMNLVKSALTLYQERVNRDRNNNNDGGEDNGDNHRINGDDNSSDATSSKKNRKRARLESSTVSKTMAPTRIISAGSVVQTRQEQLEESDQSSKLLPTKEATTQRKEQQDGDDDSDQCTTSTTATCIFKGAVRGGVTKDDLIFPPKRRRRRRRREHSGSCRGAASTTAATATSFAEPWPVRRRSRRGKDAALAQLAEAIVSGQRTLFITGAGLSVGSGIRPFRGKEGLWSEVVWSKATRKAFRDDPAAWYNDFWLPHFPPSSYQGVHVPNEGHEAIAKLAALPLAPPNAGGSSDHGSSKKRNSSSNVNVITQNVDGLHSATVTDWNWSDQLIEAHGRLGLYKCIPESDSDTDDDSDHEEDRPVKLGNRRKVRTLRKDYYEFGDGADDKQQGGASDTIKESKACKDVTHVDHGDNNEDDQQRRNDKHKSEQKRRVICRYELQESFPATMMEETPKEVRNILLNAKTWNKKTPVQVSEPPKCPECVIPCMPQALLFDEGYHAHAFYQFERMEQWIAEADVLVFVGTSFQVTITDVALQHARETGKTVYNFNLDTTGTGALESTARLNAENIPGDVGETLPLLYQAVLDEMAARGMPCYDKDDDNNSVDDEDKNADVEE